jgi:hypothetical protein
MPNNVSNKLRIQCEDSAIMAKIKKMILREKNSHEPEYTMEILLPRSQAFANSEKYDLNWNRAVWGTKWDAYHDSVSESGDTLTIHYATASRPNCDWVSVLCDYIDNVVGYNWEKEITKLSIEHRYSDYAMDFGGIIKWKPRDGFKYSHYNSYTEYLKACDKEGYNMILEAEARMRAEPDKILRLYLPI